MCTVNPGSLAPRILALWHVGSHLPGTTVGSAADQLGDPLPRQFFLREARTSLPKVGDPGGGGGGGGREQATPQTSEPIFWRSEYAPSAR